jgi:hypothetical protein
MSFRTGLACGLKKERSSPVGGMVAGTAGGGVSGHHGGLQGMRSLRGPQSVGGQGGGAHDLEIAANQNWKKTTAAACSGRRINSWRPASQGMLGFHFFARSNNNCWIMHGCQEALVPDMPRLSLDDML